ncbi:Nanos homolog 1 [Eumeta japonica]|uniref:Nanos homolog 1 n=1 Tax=Eumeta variegata TaxID=151549 RepID=A0A4C1YK24_EUMVA|nr:Nanos homolog 1 [Eumeta japonica]
MRRINTPRPFDAFVTNFTAAEFLALYCTDFAHEKKMHPTKEMLAYDAEISRLFPKNRAQQVEECSSESSGAQRPFSYFSFPNSLSSSAVDFSNADTSSQRSPIGHPSLNRLSDSSFEFNPPFNSSLNEPNYPGVTSYFSPSSEEHTSAHYSTPDEAFFSSDFSSQHHSRFDNVNETTSNENICKHLFYQSNSRFNASYPADRFTDEMNTNTSQCFPQNPRTTVADDFLLGNVNAPRALKKTFNSGTVGSHLRPPMVTYTPTFQVAPSNFNFGSPALALPINVHFLPTAVNVPTDISIPSNTVSCPSTVQVPSFSVTLSTPITGSSNSIPVSQKVNPKLNLVPKVTTSPTVFKVSPNSMKSSSSSNSDDFIEKDKICSFCRKNGENPRVYMTHLVKKKINGKYVVTCPILRTYVCSVCNASGDNAHTITYCPLLKNAGISVKPTTISLKNSKIKSDGKLRFPPKS